MMQQHNRHSQRLQKGFVLPAFLVVLIVTGSSLIAGSPSLQSSESASSTHSNDRLLYLHAAQQIQQLHRAKQQLIAYAVTYADNYGPGGAGPGHLPCPDRDPPDDGNPNNDGPDPPCGHSLIQVGRLPRLTLAERRIVESDASSTTGLNRFKLLEFFPAQSFVDRQPWYWLDDGFINNPINRQVNSSITTEKLNRQGRQVVAVLLAPGAERHASGQRRPGLDAGDYVESLEHALANGWRFTRDHQATTNDLQVFVYLDEILPWVEQRVAGFLVDKVAENIDALQQALDQGNTCETAFVATRVQRLATCFDWLLDDGKLDGIAAQRHWFFRNGWHQQSGVSIDPSCMSSGLEHCVVSRLRLTDPPLPDSSVSLPNILAEVVFTGVSG